MNDTEPPAIDEYEVIEEFELPAECQADYATINRWPDGDLTATPFVIREEGVFATEGRTWYDEPDRDEWSPSPEYRQAISERSEHDIEEIQIKREWAEPEGYL